LFTVLHLSLHFSPEIIGVTKSRIIWWTCSAYRGGERCIQSFGGDTWGKDTTWKTQA